MEMKIKQIFDKNEKRQIARHILEDLTDWFEIQKAREEYIKKNYMSLAY